ncbi:MAG: hypothetical protein K6T83_20805 [Alicyclobacillus sp.]|nr:hypothetical protein [Alicyclobacillus sp.]
MQTPTYLHHALIGTFLLIFALMSIVGMYRLYRERRLFGGTLLLLATVVFAYCTVIAYRG